MVAEQLEVVAHGNERSRNDLPSPRIIVGEDKKAASGGGRWPEKEDSEHRKAPFRVVNHGSAGMKRVAAERNKSHVKSWLVSGMKHDPFALARMGILADHVG